MKKVLKKLALNRETLASLQPDLLEAVGGGNAASATGITTTTRTITTTTTTSTTRPPRTISICPSLFNCPSVPSLAGGGKEGQ